MINKREVPFDYSHKKMHPFANMRVKDQLAKDLHSVGFQQLECVDDLTLLANITIIANLHIAFNNTNYNRRVQSLTLSETNYNAQMHEKLGLMMQKSANKQEIEQEG